MKKNLVKVLTVLLWLSISLGLEAQSICSNEVIEKEGYIYEFWADNPKSEACMTLGQNGQFSGNWNFVSTIQFRKGIRPATGKELIEYNIHFYPQGNAWTGVFGKAEHPKAVAYKDNIDFYIIENWGSWRPPGTFEAKKTFFSDGEIYDIYQFHGPCVPMMLGESYCYEYFSVRQTRRDKGTITLSNHIEAWNQLGMKIKNIKELSFCMEGYQSKGSIDVLSMEIISNQEQPTPSTIRSFIGDVNDDESINIIDALLVAQYYVGIKPDIFIQDNADVNIDLKIDILDSLLISQCYVGIIACNF
ncbi:MAG: glycoside hydrolase family 11 protein [Spirochaetales bacterium]|nr:glycoside hydrolase family 11 protein [Spirochaetales bacterium]